MRFNLRNSRGLIRHRNRNTRSAQGLGQKRDWPGHMCCRGNGYLGGVRVVGHHVHEAEVDQVRAAAHADDATVQIRLVLPGGFQTRKDLWVLQNGTETRTNINSTRSASVHAETLEVSNSQEHSNEHKRAGSLDLDQQVKTTESQRDVTFPDLMFVSDSFSDVNSWAHNEQFNPDQNEIQRVIHFNKERLSCKNCWMK